MFLHRYIPAALLALLGAGCSSEPQFRLNSVELLKQERMELGDNQHFPDEQIADVGDILTAMFGTPDEPWFPFLEGDQDPAHELIDLQLLQQAAGAVRSDRSGMGQGLYREHCAHCHGISGDGAGPTASFLNPYPRDFRLGKFKFKSTPLRVPPTDDDLRRLIRDGIPGTAMPSFRLLDDQEIDALVDYVKYLALRGEVERRLLAELGHLDGQRLIDPLSDSGDNQQRRQQQLDMVLGDCYLDLLDRWLDVDQRITEVPAPGAGFDLYGGDAIDRGRQLFLGKANCVQCHGATGLGDGQTENFDDWTNEWVKGANVNPLDASSYQDFINAGAFPPRPIRPRNLRLRAFRGGNTPADLYRRIANGIEGTPMPAATTLSSDEIWSLVAYVLNMPDEPMGQ